jgi:HD superfamily phosphohydrolase
VTNDVAAIRLALRDACPELMPAVEALVTTWMTPLERRLAAISKDIERGPRAKHVNDPVWRTFEIEPHEVLLLDSPMLQRMRGVKQLGLANLVFPGANHDRFEHICGTVQAAEEVYQAIRRNAERRRPQEQKENRAPPQLDEHHRLQLRLAALLHDVGHGPFSHAIEPVVAKRYAADVKSFNRVVREHLQLDAKAAVAEIISVLIAVSAPLAAVLANGHFASVAPDGVASLQVQLATLILGARRHGELACLSAIISGQVDADKMDYMARDALHSGMPIEFDTERLLWKLEIIRCTPENLPAAQRDNKVFAEGSPGRSYYDLGIAASGVGALEQMLIGRAFLYDRLYHHHKVRAADAMAQRMLHYAREALARPYDLAELYQPVGDDTLIRLFAGELSKEGFPDPGPQAAQLGGSLLSRDLYLRAMAFRASFHTAGTGEKDEEKRTQARAEAWSPVSTALADLDGRLEAERAIVEIAKRIAPSCGDGMKTMGESLDPSHVIVDLAENRVKRVTINVHLDDGSLEEPNLFFDPARWSQVYDLQKRTGYVFCHRDYLPLVAIAAKLYFFERWGYVATEKADRVAKTTKLIDDQAVARLVSADAIDEAAASVLRREKTVLTFVHEGDVNWPADWLREEPEIDKDFVDDLLIKLPQGLPAGDRDALIRTVEALAQFVSSAHLDRTFATSDIDEAELQTQLARHLRATGIDVTEGREMSGGETDLIVDRRFLIENKEVGQTGSPFTAKSGTPYQANRYSVALSSRVFMTVAAYKPLEDGAPIAQTESIRVTAVPDAGRTVVNLQAVVPYGMKSPSKVRKPASK